MGWTRPGAAADKERVNPFKSLFGLGRRSRRRDPWRVAGPAPRGTDSGVDFSEAWTLPEGGVAWLRTSAAGEVVFRRQSVDALDPGGLYRFTVLAAVHRCRAELVLDVLDNAGAVLETLRRGLSPDARGGRERGAYDRAEVEFRAPTRAARLVASVRKGPGSPGQDSFLFLAEPTLRPLEQPGPDQTAFQSPPAGPVAAPPHRAAGPFNRRRHADPRRIAAARNWLARAGDVVPALDLLSAALDAGVVGRADLPRLTFPPAPAAQVTVLLDAGADLEVLWLSLAGLLSAANAVDFEVKVLASPTLDAAAIGGGAAGISIVEGAPPRPSAGHVVLLAPGFEPVAGWLDALLAVRRSFAAVAATPKVIGADGLTPAGVNPRDPQINFVRPVAQAQPLMIAADLLGDASDVAGLVAQAHAALRERAEPILYCPTAEIYRLTGAEAPSQASQPQASEPAPAFRVLFIDQEAPTVDMDAGGYAAFQEMRMLQALGGKVDFLPKNLAWMDRHTLALERAGVECHYPPFRPSFDRYFREHAADYDLIFVLRY